MQKIIIICLVAMALCNHCFGESSVVDVNAAGKNVTILFIGDSISVGVGSSVPANRYTTLVTNTLNKQSKGYEYKEINLAISGSTLVDQPWPEPNASAYPYVLQRAIREKPDIVVIQHGTNDNGVGSSIGQFLWSYRHVVCTIKEKLPRTTIVCMTICPSWGVANSTKEWLNQANVGIQEIAAMENTLLAQTNFKLKNRRELFPDGIHPNDKGHRIMAESVIEAINENKIQSKNGFDFIVMGFGQYRICGYVFDIKAESSDTGDGWVCFHDINKDGFTYIADYSTTVASSFKLYDRDFKATVLQDINTPGFKCSRNNYTGQGMFVLPRNNGKEITVRIE